MTWARKQKTTLKRPLTRKKVQWKSSRRIGPFSERNTVIITRGHIIVPEGLDLRLEEQGVLEIFPDRLRERPSVVPIVKDS